MGKATRLAQEIAGKIRGKAAKAADSTCNNGPKADPSEASSGPSPNPMTNLILADFLLRAGERLLRRSVETGVLGQKHGQSKAQKIVRGRSLAQTLIGTAIARIATRSVPGAIVVGGGLLAKTLYDRRKDAKAHAEDKEALEKQADKA